jgi:hypothetical protein
MSGNENATPLTEPDPEIQEEPSAGNDDRNQFMTNEPLTNNLDSSFGRYIS